MKLSIVIPMKNEADNIEVCLQSILDSDFPREEYEIICVDNGSDDNSVVLAQKLISCTYDVPLRSISFLRNYGVTKAKGDYVAFVDADCTVDPLWMRSASRYFGDPKVVCFGATPEVPMDATWVQKTWFLHKGARKDIEVVEWLESMNLFVRRSIFKEVGGFNEALKTCEDVDLCYRISQKYQIVSDKRIKVIHLGEAKTLADFFKKERWRGSSNFKGIREHGVSVKEIPSIMIPTYYLLLPLLIAVLFFLKGPVVSGLSLLFLSLAPVFFISLHVCRKSGQYGYLAKASIVYLVYFIARAVSMVS